jgi:large subunit ribosomal protein L15
MQIHEIKRVHPNKKSKLVARGGKRGKTAGKGGKGQTARAGHRVRPMMRDIIKKLPKLRGHGKNRAKSVFDRGPEAVVNVGVLSVFAAGDVVNPTSLIAKGLIKPVMGKHPEVKILGTGEIAIALTIERCTVSGTAREKIEKAGGTVPAIIIKEVKPPKPVKVAKAKAKPGKTKKK